MLLKEIKYTYYCNDLRFWDNIIFQFLNDKIYNNVLFDITVNFIIEK